MNSETEFQLPQLYRHDVFACHVQRPPTHPHASCGAAGAQVLWDRMRNAIEAQGLTDIGFTAAGCLGFCNAGPLMAVYPDGIWYRPTTADDIDEIIESHLKEGKRVDRLVVVLKRS
ncbi:ferredoxin [Bradyrhizobium sp. RDI18]|uniref:(2Fe-2S) ferredoxin domain-containing protein n=1 Tax=Bradyrhizobium sp. RDI18 TaxID=3367400 RepID=UPI00371C2D02